jgi:hypothetical protein
MLAFAVEARGRKLAFAVWTGGKEALQAGLPLSTAVGRELGGGAFWVNVRGWGYSGRSA